jgi:hypothetical protein
VFPGWLRQPGCNRRGYIYIRSAEEIKLIGVVRRDDRFLNPPLPGMKWQRHDVTRLGCMSQFKYILRFCKR